MSTDQNQPKEATDATEFLANWTKICNQSQSLVHSFLQRQAKPQQTFQLPDPQVVARAFGELYQHMVSDPGKLLQHQLAMWQDFLSLSERTTRAFLGESPEPVIQPASDDKRFRDDDWHENPLFDYIKQSYLLASKHLLSTVRDVDGLDDKTAKQADFYARQFVDAMAPTNFISTNPKVLRETLDSGGQNLLRGLQNLLDDLEQGQGKLRIKMTDLDAFELGKNVAATSGKIIFENALMQLIQYTPTTEKVHKRPLLIVPPWINKFYILDLRPKNSFIKWAIDQGHTVFVISWVNPDASLAKKSFADYMQLGPLAALDAIQQSIGEKEVKAIGYCLGGTLLAATLAYMAQQQDQRIKAATFLTTMVDFSEPGELGVFIDDFQLDRIEKQMQAQGFFEGDTMAEAFNLLRANDLIWNFVINNYLLGKEPFPFDLLYWNSDSTRMPCEMHSFYLRKMYQQNLLAKPNGISLSDTAINLRNINIPTYILATKEDHIAPWKSAYAATQLYAGATRFVLGGSGHIAGVINPPAANKYAYVTNEQLPVDPEQWLQTGTTHEGSWWSDWDQWISPFNGKSVAARDPEQGQLAPIEEAPGRYVKTRSNN